MKKLLPFFMFCLSFSLQAQESKVVFKLKENSIVSSQSGKTGIKQLDEISSRYHAAKVEKVKTGRKAGMQVFTAAFPDNTDLQAIIRDYTATGLVAYAEQEGTATGGGMCTTVPNDANYGRQWGLKNNGDFPFLPATAGADIDMELAWDLEQGSSDIIVAVLDTGVYMEHPEFEGRIWENTGEIADNGIDDDNNGYEDDVYGWDAIYIDNNPNDVYGHGTNVAGIVCANGNNMTGYTGEDLNCRLMCVKVLNDNNSGSYTAIAEGVYYAVDNGAHVINMSLGGTQASSVLKEAIDYAEDNGVIVVACMMNFNSSQACIPAAYDYVIAVGATDPNDSRSAPFFWDVNSGSNYGSHIDVVAPGNYIYGLANVEDDNFESYWGGTSQAAPLVAGLASLLLAQDSQRTPAQVKAIIENSAEDQVGNFQDVSGFDNYYGHGRINAYNALAGIMSTTDFDFTSTVTVYPNPSAGSFTVSMPQYPAQATVYNTVGQVVLHKEITGADSKIDLNSSGIYILSLTYGNSTAVKKIIVE